MKLNNNIGCNLNPTEFSNFGDFDVQKKIKVNIYLVLRILPVTAIKNQIYMIINI
jgi:hypothetical protein